MSDLLLRSRLGFIALLASVWLSLGLPPTAAAEPPGILTVLPIGIARGERIEVQISGEGLVEGGRLWSSFLPEPVSHMENQPDRFVLDVPADVQEGVHAVRVVTADGVSRLQPILVDGLASVSGVEDNTTWDTAQSIELPAAVDGFVSRLSRRFYRFTAESGQRVSFEVWARRLGSPLDPVLFLYDADGQPLAYADDTPGLAPDAQIPHTFDEAGEYVLEVRDVQYGGGEGTQADTFFFRLRIGDFPCINAPFPPVIPATEPSRIGFTGLDVDGLSSHAVDPKSIVSRFHRVATGRPGGSTRAFAAVALSDRPQVSEQEPNDVWEQANRVEIGSGISGRFETPGDVDLYRFRANRDDRLRLKGLTRRLGLPTELLLRILDETGGPLARLEAAGSSDAVLDVTIPGDGEYVIEVSELHRRYGSEFGYHLEFVRRTPFFVLTAHSDVINVPTGGVAAIGVEAERMEFSGPIELACEGLPEGITAMRTVIGRGWDEAILTLQADRGLTRGELSAIRIVGRARDGGRELTAHAGITDPFRRPWNHVAFLPGPFEDSLALGVTSESALNLSVEPAELELAKGSKGTFKVRAERGSEIDEAIQLTPMPERNPLPHGLSVSVKNIDQGTNEAEVEVTASGQAPTGPFTLVLVGFHKKGNTSTRSWTPGITLTVKDNAP